MTTYTYTYPPASTVMQEGITPLRDAFRAKYPKTSHILDYFEMANGCDATWQNLSKVKLQRFVDYLGTIVSPNTVVQYCKQLKAVFNLYSEEISLPQDYDKVLSPKKCSTTAVFLTERDLDKLAGYIPKDAEEDAVKRLFLISAYTGCRHSDAERMTESNIQNGHLVYVSKKTKTPTQIPLKPIVADLIRSKPSVTVTKQGYNKIIKRICRMVGINQPSTVFVAGKERNGYKWEFVSSHTARRSFASNLYLRGVDIYTISKFCGHSDIKQTEHYIVPQTRELSDMQMKFFA